MEFLVLLLFAAGLMGCLFFDISVIVALLWGYMLFFSYGLYRHFSARDLVSLSLDGIKTVKTILIAFIFIGMLTASWRACGTIPIIIYSSSIVMIPEIFLLITFLLNSLVSFLTGTSFGTMATIGVICMTIGNIMGIDPALLGGASLSGIYFGDRCSPMSTSALLVAGLTKTDLYKNIKLMFRTSLVPTIATCLIYAALGLTVDMTQASTEILGLFAQNFNLHWLTLVPALLIIALSALRLPVIKTMIASTAAAAVICFSLQGMSIPDILAMLALGYHAADPTLAAMMDGGGISSMFTVGAIVCISASYFGIFDKTGLLKALENHIGALAERITIYGSAIVVSILTGMISCNQSLASMLTYQLCKTTERDSQRLAIILENTTVVIAALIPWNIAVAVPLHTWNVPMTSILFACYLYLLPGWNLLVNRKA